jgi:prevent-host-death family protein
MNTLTAAELKRRGMSAIEEGLRRGPVHLVKRNKPAAVVVSANEYARLSLADAQKLPGMTAVEWLLNQPGKGRKRKQQLDKDLRAERDGWA